MGQGAPDVPGSARNALPLFWIAGVYRRVRRGLAPRAAQTIDTARQRDIGRCPRSVEGCRKVRFP
jgi:hypothetical protein